MESAQDHHDSHHGNSSVPNHGVASFLRHFSSHRNTKDGSSQLNKSNRLLRNLGRSSTSTNGYTTNAKHGSSQWEDSTLSPRRSSTSGETTTIAFHRTKGKFFGQREEEDIITFDSDSTRLGIRPTCYDFVPIRTHDDGTPINNNSNNHIDEEVYFLNNNVAAAASVTPLSSSSIPNLFSNLPIWEETRQDDLQDRNHISRSSSPQKSVGSCDSIKSDGSMEQDEAEEEYFTFAMPPPSSPSKERRNTNRNRSNSSSSVTTKTSTNLMQKAKAMVQRSRDKENNSCDSSQISASSSIVSMSKLSRKSKKGANNTSTHVDTVKIFLLLVEPKSKVFELIQLMYPRNKTKVIDLLKMIPKNATEQVLATQPYVGITRPKRRSDPITDLDYLASNSVFNVTGSPTAAIEPGEIIVALPASASTKEIVVLSKQILASTHIQKLISISKGQTGGGPTTDAHGRSKIGKKRKSDKSIANMSKTSTAAPPLLEEGSSYPATAASFQPIQESLLYESRSPKIVSFFDANCTEELKRGIDNANLANEEAGCSPSTTPTSFLSNSIDTTDPGHQAKSVEFPRDMLDAYMSKDAVLKMCTTPNNASKIPNIECTSSSSMVDDTEETDADASSCDGSMTSSFHSWALSLDSTSIPSTGRSNGYTVNDRSIASTTQLLSQKKKRIFTRKMKRVAVLSFIASIARYHIDPNGLYSTPNLRRMKLFEPMGFVGFLCFVLLFGVLTKLQMYYTRRCGLGQVTQKTRCPALRSISKLYKRFQRSVSTSDTSFNVDNLKQRELSLVPTSIHAIKFE